MHDKIKIVIADDHPLMNHGLSSILQNQHDFILAAQAYDGFSALELIKETKPDIAVLDVQMPGMDGFEVARTVIREGLTAKIVFLTMYSDDVFVKKVFELGVKGYVLKENALMDIVNCIRVVMRGEFFISPQISNILLSNNSGKYNNSILTQSEKNILHLIGQGKSSKEIAAELFISVKTVENHRSNICKKLGITGSSALLKYALTNPKKL